MTINEGHKASDTGTYDEDTYRRELTAEELELTEAKVSKVNARAAKRGWNGRLTIDARREVIKEENSAGIEVSRVVYMTVITGDAPCYEGWTFLAVLDWHSAGGELITRVSPGVELDGVIDRSSLRPGECDHCGTIRDRKDIYLVRNDQGQLKQVGSSCIKDFLGWSVLPAFVSQDESDDLYESMPSGARWVDFEVETVLTVAWALIKRDGFKPASFYGDSTKSATMTVLDPRTDKERQFAQEARALVGEAREQAHQIRAYILSDETFPAASEYAVNLKTALRAEYVTSRLFGLVASAPQAWAKSVERDLTVRAERESVCNEWIGQAGDKLEIEVTVKSIRPIDGDWGTSYLYTMSDPDGHVVKWFSSSKALGGDVTGQAVRIKGTVKKLETYNDTKSTVLTRCKVL